MDQNTALDGCGQAGSVGEACITHELSRNLATNLDTKATVTSRKSSAKSRIVFSVSHEELRQCAVENATSNGFAEV